MKQALEQIIQLVDRVDIRSSSLEVRNILRLIAETARKSLEAPTILLSSVSKNDVQRFAAKNTLGVGASNHPVVCDFHAIAVPLTGKEAIRSVNPVNRDD